MDYSANRLCRLDEKTRSFRTGFDTLAQRLRQRYYTSVSDFSRDLSKIFAEALASVGNPGPPSKADIEAIHTQLNEVKPGTAAHMALTQEQKDLKRLAKRIVKAVKQPLEAAMKKEAEIRGLELEEQLRKLDSMGIFASATSRSTDAEGEDGHHISPNHRRVDSDTTVVAGAEDQDHNEDVDMPDADPNIDPSLGNGSMIPFANDTNTAASEAASHASTDPDVSLKRRSGKGAEPLSPPISRSSSGPAGVPASASGDSSNSTVEVQDVFAHGGVPWYLEPFDPIGTTIHEERYTGRAVLRAMSEELSDMDEDTLTNLAAPRSLQGATPNGKLSGPASVASSSVPSSATRKASSRKRPKRSR